MDKSVFCTNVRTWLWIANTEVNSSHVPQHYPWIHRHGHIPLTHADPCPGTLLLLCFFIFRKCFEKLYYSSNFIGMLKWDLDFICAPALCCSQFVFTFSSVILLVGSVHGLYSSESINGLSLITAYSPTKGCSVLSAQPFHNKKSKLFCYCWFVLRYMTRVML